MTSTVDVSVHTALTYTQVNIKLQSSGDTIWLSIDSCNIFVNAESAARIIEALRPLVPQNIGVEPQDIELNDPSFFDDEIPF